MPLKTKICNICGASFVSIKNENFCRECQITPNRFVKDNIIAKKFLSKSTEFINIEQEDSVDR